MVRTLLDNNSDKILEVLGKEGGLVDGHFNADVTSNTLCQQAFLTLEFRMI